MTEELKRVRDWARAELQAGRVDGESWNRYVKLVEAADAVLQDVRFATNLRGTGLQAVRFLDRPAASNENRRRRPLTRRH